MPDAADLREILAIAGPLLWIVCGLIGGRLWYRKSGEASASVAFLLGPILWIAAVLREPDVLEPGQLAELAQLQVPNGLKTEVRRRQRRANALCGVAVLFCLPFGAIAMGGQQEQLRGLPFYLSSLSFLFGLGLFWYTCRLWCCPVCDKSFGRIDKLPQVCLGCGTRYEDCPTKDGERRPVDLD